MPELQLAVLLWCLWLLVHWVLATMLGPPLRLERWIILIAAVGWLALWPALCLSRRPSRPAIAGRPLRARPGPGMILAEWFALALVFQALAWPLGFIAGWTLRQTAWVNTAMLSWALLTAAFVAWGAAARRARERVVAMTLCLMLLVGEPLLVSLLAMLGPRGWDMRLTAVASLWHLTAPHAQYQPQPWVSFTLSMAVTAAAAWGIVVAVTRARATVSA